MRSDFDQDRPYVLAMVLAVIVVWCLILTALHRYVPQFWQVGF